MTKEKEKKPSNKINIPCQWCGMLDERKIMFGHVRGDPDADIENPGSFHKKCYKADKIFFGLRFSDADLTRKQMIKTANKLAGVDIKRRKNKKWRWGDGRNLIL